MPYCRSCGAQHEADDRFCTDCGKPTAQKPSPDAPVATALGAAPKVATAPPQPVVPPPHQFQSSPAVAAAVSSSNPPPAHVYVAPPPPPAMPLMLPPAGRPGGVTFIAIMAFISAGILILAAMVYFTAAAGVGEFADQPIMRLLAWLMPVIGDTENDMLTSLNIAAVLALLFAAASIAAGYGLLKLRKWGWIAALVVLGLGVLHALAMLVTSEGTIVVHLLGAGLEVWAGVYLLQAKTKQRFAN